MKHFAALAIVSLFVGFGTAMIGYHITDWEFWVFAVPICTAMGYAIGSMGS